MSNAGLADQRLLAGSFGAGFGVGEPFEAAGAQLRGELPYGRGGVAETLGDDLGGLVVVQICT